MGEPYKPPRRDFMPSDKVLDNLSEQTDNVLDIDAFFKKIVGNFSSQTYRPDDEMLKNFYRLYTQPAGRELVEWILDITIRLPYPKVGSTIEMAALQAARREAAANIGELLMQAVLEGKRLIEREANAMEL